MNLIITGAAGHLATTIIEKLADSNYTMRGLLLPGENGVKQDNIKYYEGDITRPESLDQLFERLEPKETIVLHTAAIISIQDKVSPAVQKVNVEGTKNVIAKCKQYHVKRLVYVSSVHALPEPDKISMIYEVDHFDKNAVEGAYAITKAEATQAVLDAGKEGLDVVVLHPSGIVGPGDKGRNHIVQMVQMYVRGKMPAGVSGGFDFVDVRDVADGIISALQKGRSGECYILSNRFVPVSELTAFMRMATGRKNHKSIVPLWVAKAVAPAFEWYAKVTHTRPIFTKYALATMEMNGHYCHDKATMELGYRPRDMKYTIKDTIDWLQMNKAL